MKKKLFVWMWHKHGCMLTHNNCPGFSAKNELPLVRFAAQNAQAIQMSSPSVLMHDYRLGFSAKNGLPLVRFAAQNMQAIQMSSPSVLMRDYRPGFSAKNGLPPW